MSLFRQCTIIIIQTPCARVSESVIGSRPAPFIHLNVFAFNLQTKRSFSWDESPKTDYRALAASIHQPGTRSVIVFASICFFMVRNFILLVEFHFHSSLGSPFHSIRKPRQCFSFGDRHHGARERRIEGEMLSLAFVSGIKQCVFKWN